MKGAAVATIAQDLLVNIDANTERLRRELRRMEKQTASSQRRVDRSLKSIDKSFKRLNRAGAAFAAVYASAMAIRGTVRAADEQAILRARIEAATKATGDYQDVYERLLETAIKTGTALAANVDMFQRVNHSASALGATTEDVTRLNAVIQQLGVLGGSSTEAINAGTLQLAQGLGAGILRAEEFNSVVENLPEVALALARGLGVEGVGALRKMVLEGKVLSQDVFAALLKQQEEINQRFEDMPSSLSRGFSSYLTAIKARLGDVNEEFGVTAKMGEIYENLAEIIAPPNAEERIKSLTDEIARLNRELANAPTIWGGESQTHKRIRKKISAAEAERDSLIVGGALDDGNIPIVTKPPRIDGAARTDRGVIGIDIADRMDSDDTAREEARDRVYEGREETVQLLKELEIEALKSSDRLVEAARAEAAQELAIWRQRHDQGIATEEQLAQARILINKNTAAEIKDIQENEFSRLRELTDQFAEDFGAIFIEGTDSVGDSFSNMAKSFKNALLKMLADALIIAPLQNLLGTLTGGLTGGGGLLSGLFGRAVGGPVMGKQPYIVGERGPELFVPRGNGDIIPNHRMPTAGPAAAPAVHITQHLHFDTTLESVDTRIAQSAPRLVEASKGAVLDAMNRGGAYRKGALA